MMAFCIKLLLPVCSNRPQTMAGYRVWHTQLLVCIAMVWRSFSHYNPTALSYSVTILMVMELALLWRWRPATHAILNGARIREYDIIASQCVMHNNHRGDSHTVAMIISLRGFVSSNV
jgi:hypothetical protein